MLGFLKKLSIPAYLFPISAIIALAGMIVAIVSCTGEGFGMQQLPLVIGLTVAAVVLCAAILFVSAKKGDNVISSLCVYAMVVILGACVYAMVVGKSDVFGTVIFSDLEKGYAPAEFASNMGVVSIVLYLVSAVAAAVGAFFRLDKQA